MYRPKHRDRSLEDIVCLILDGDDNDGEEAAKQEETRYELMAKGEIKGKGGDVLVIILSAVSRPTPVIPFPHQSFIDISSAFSLLHPLFLRH